MIFIYLPFAVLLIFFSLRSFSGGVEYLRFFKQELGKPRSDFAPFATVFAPCKGLDEGLRDNLRSLLKQDYPAYEVVFVVDNADDPATSAIADVSRTAAAGAKLVVAPRAVRSGQKVENLREAVLHADERSRMFVFVDSDVRTAGNWLRSLVAPLEDGSVGAATGYRWFVSDRTRVAAELRSAWNASIASALGPNTRSNFCWGGSMAVRREVFERLNIRDRWHGTLSDDFTVTRAMNEAGLPIRFVPQAVVPSPGSCSAAELFEFTNRQMKITRVYARHLWLMSFFGSGLFNSVMLGSVLILLLYPSASPGWIVAALTLLIVTALSLGKAWLRFRAMRLVLVSPALDRQLLYQLGLTMLTPAVFLINSVAALFSTTIVWRGTRYTMVSPTETVVDDHDLSAETRA